jgi:class 3 adenylate cyclase
MHRVIERYFSRYLDAVREAGGEVTEILGDGLVAVFEGRDLREDGRRAITAAWLIRQATAALNARTRERFHPMVVNAGVAAGRALVGLTRLHGWTGEREVYSATGPVANIAARLCALASGGQILVDAAVAAAAGDAWSIPRVGPRTLRNVGRPVEVFEVKGPRAESRPARSIRMGGSGLTPRIGHERAGIAV